MSVFPEIKTIVVESKNVSDFPKIPRESRIASAPTSIFNSINLKTVGAIVEKEEKLPTNTTEFLKFIKSKPNLNELKIDQLKQILGSLNLAKTGRKADFIKRLEDYAREHDILSQK